MPLNLNHLAVFQAVAEAGSVSVGAEKLLVSQPAVSKQIKELERAIQTQLFERHARGVRLTDAGTVLADYARRIFGLAAEAEQALNDLSALRRGTLAIGAGTTVGVYLLPRALVHFRRRFPGIQLHLEIGVAATLRRRLEENALDLVLTEGVVESPEVESALFAEDELVAIAPPGHPLAARKSVPLDVLCREPFLTRETGSESKSLVERVLAQRGLSITPVLSLDSTEAIKQGVAAGLGVAIVSRLAVKREIAGKQIAEIRIKGVKLRRPIYHLRPRGRRQSKAAEAFLCIVRHELRGTLEKIMKKNRMLKDAGGA